MNIYRYNVALTYTYNNQSVLINNTNIHSIVIDYSYDDRNMPMLFITASIDKNIVDDMIANCQTKKLILTIRKFINNADIKIEENYIQGEFMYLLSNDENYNKSLDYSKDTTDSKDIYREVMIGMIKQDLIDKNKITINDVIKNSTLMTSVIHYLNNMKLLIEPIRYNLIDYLVIPPLNSISKLIAYLDNCYSLYTNKYRLFYDYDKTYLLSSSGKEIPSSDELYSSVIIKVMDVVSSDSKLQGMDIENNSYVIYVDTNSININKDNATYATNNSTMTIGTNGDYAISGTGSKYKIIRSTTDNLTSASVDQSEKDNNSFSISLVKTDIDTSVFTINKSYYIQNYPALQDQNGKFLLSSKKEIYSPQDGGYQLTTQLIFRKAIS